MLIWYYLSTVALSLHTQTTNPINRTKKKQPLHISDTVTHSQSAGRLRPSVSKVPFNAPKERKAYILSAMREDPTACILLCLEN